MVACVSRVHVGMLGSSGCAKARMCHRGVRGFLDACNFQERICQARLGLVCQRDVAEACERGVNCGFEAAGIDGTRAQFGELAARIGRELPLPAVFRTGRVFPGGLSAGARVAG